MKILMLLTRPLTGSLSGRKMALRSAHEAFSRVSDVTVAYVKDSEIQTKPSEQVELSRPSFVDFILNFISFLFCGWSLNEVVFYSRKNQKLILDLIYKEQYDYVYVDSIRMMTYVSGRVNPNRVILDFDDMYSVRYARLYKSKEPIGSAFLGFYGSKLPSFVFAIAAQLSKLILFIESSKVSKREVYYSGFSNKLTIVSPIEANLLSDKIKKHVHDIAMAVPDYSKKWRFSEVKSNILRLCILGNFDYYPNLQSLRYINEHVIPLFIDAGYEIRLDVIGKASDKVRIEFDSNVFRFCGFVDDLGEIVANSVCFLSPIISGTGIKTKVLDSFSLGVPVVTNAKGVEGLGVRENMHILLASSPSEYVASIIRLASDRTLSESISESAYQFFSKNFRKDLIENKWYKLLEINL